MWYKFEITLGWGFCHGQNIGKSEIAKSEFKDSEFKDSEFKDSEFKGHTKCCLIASVFNWITSDFA